MMLPSTRTGNTATPHFDEIRKDVARVHWTRLEPTGNVRGWPARLGAALRGNGSSAARDNDDDDDRDDESKKKRLISHEESSSRFYEKALTRLLARTAATLGKYHQGMCFIMAFAIQYYYEGGEEVRQAFARYHRGGGCEGEMTPSSGKTSPTAASRRKSALKEEDWDAIRTRSHDENVIFDAVCGELLLARRYAALFETDTCFLTSVIDRIDFVLLHALPELHARLQSANVLTDFFALDLLTTLFTSLTHLETCREIWMLMLLSPAGDDRFLVRCIVVLLRCVENHLKTEDQVRLRRRSRGSKKRFSRSLEEILAAAVVGGGSRRWREEKDVSNGGGGGGEEDEEDERLLTRFKSVLRGVGRERFIETYRETLADERWRSTEEATKAFFHSIKELETAMRDPREIIIKPSYDATFLLRAIQFEDESLLRQTLARYSPPPSFSPLVAQYALLRAVLLGFAPGVRTLLRRVPRLDARCTLLLEPRSEDEEEKRGYDDERLLATPVVTSPLELCVLLGNNHVLRELLLHSFSREATREVFSREEVENLASAIETRRKARRERALEGDDASDEAALVILRRSCCLRCGYLKCGCAREATREEEEEESEEDGRDDNESEEEEEEEEGASIFGSILWGSFGTSPRAEDVRKKTTSPEAAWMCRGCESSLISRPNSRCRRCRQWFCPLCCLSIALCRNCAHFIGKCSCDAERHLHCDHWELSARDYLPPRTNACEACCTNAVVRNRREAAVKQHRDDGVSPLQDEVNEEREENDLKRATATKEFVTKFFEERVLGGIKEKLSSSSATRV